jgi:type IV pilus assembly protein PilE
MKTSAAVKSHTSARGFTLIELMIVVAIIGLITAIALPSYKNSVAKARRAEARGQLLEAAQYMQRFYSQNDSFATTRAGAAVVIPTAIATVPKTAATATVATYNISFTVTPTIAAFTLTAVPRAAGPMGSDKCGSFFLDQTGRRSVSGTLGTDSCWR